MQVVHAVSLERLCQSRMLGEGGVNLPATLSRVYPGCQDYSDVGFSTASTSQSRAIPICRQYRRGHIFSASWLQVRSSSSRANVVANSRRKENGSDKENAFAGDSPLAKEEVMLIFYQLEIERRLQRALNQDQYETAQNLREKIVEFEQIVTRQKQEKMGSLSPKEEEQDTSIRLLQLRTELQKTIEQEDYPGAARLRDKIAELEAEALVASAKARIYENIKYAFRLGQKIRHKKFGFRGVICGMDPVCFESAEWIEENGIEQLPGGVNQPFYQVLVDVQANPSVLVAYVAEESLIQPSEPDLERFDHPYTYYLFYGVDAAGDFIPVRQLREKYNAPRHEIPWEGDESSPGGDGIDSM